MKKTLRITAYYRCKINGAYISLSKLALLNSIIAQAQAHYMDVFVFGISSWFASQRLILKKQSLRILLAMVQLEQKLFVNF